MKTPRNGATSLALALLFLIGAISMSTAKTFVYVEPKEPEPAEKDKKKP